jgi:hypothetical protein
MLFIPLSIPFHSLSIVFNQMKINENIFIGIKGGWLLQGWQKEGFGRLSVMPLRGRRMPYNRFMGMKMMLGMGEGMKMRERGNVRIIKNLTKNLKICVWTQKQRKLREAA